MTQEGYSTGEVVQRTGISYRQIHYWVQKGYITPSVRESSGPGFNNAMLWSDDDLDTLEKIGKFIQEGFTRQAAFERAGV